MVFFPPDFVNSLISDEIWTQYHLSDLQSTDVDEEDDVQIVVSEPGVDYALEDVHTHSVSSAGPSGSSSASLSGPKEEKLAVKEKSLDRGSKPPSHVSPLLSAGSPSSITLTIVEWIEVIILFCTVSFVSIFLRDCLECILDSELFFSHRN